MKLLLLRYLHQLGPLCAREYIKLEVVVTPNPGQSFISFVLETDPVAEKSYLVIESTEFDLKKSTKEKIEFDTNFHKQDHFFGTWVPTKDYEVIE
uniref:AlNc14C91G5689 protein n=1 Tax=Albugo laibachii Nc14 TaxID=890382 RepID=F0WGF7_9STRA|nr:AlNc14C91G5689 [Albugo laibachii Nc14]|eukprot:CCA20318.1 AlNc14C91G5689 [Albugo laibachii Nc14]